MGMLAGKIAAITGAGSGVGRETAVLFAREGAKLILIDVRQDRLDETKALVSAAGGEAYVATADVGDEGSLTAALGRGVETFGRLDIMHNNAGIGSPPREDGRPRKFTECTPADWDRLQSVNIAGAINGSRFAIERFRAQGGGGVIINTASIAGMMGWGGVLYGATKGAIVIFTKALAIEVGPEKIRVNAVCPGGMFTNFGIGAAGPVSDAIKAEVADINPLRELIDPVDCAKAALYLASDLAVRITGVCLPVDAGLSAGR